MLGVLAAWWLVGPSWLRTLAFGLALSSELSAGAPHLPSSSTRQGQLRTRRAPLFLDEQAQDYLMNFGYIPQSDRETGNLRSEDQLRDAFRTLQHFGNIPVTGELDNATLALMKKPRCGLPDIIPAQRRKKRFVLHGQKWHYTNLTWSLRSEYIHNLDHGQVRSELHRALQVWSKHSKLTFTEINSDRADILVYFYRGYHGDGYEFDGRGKILAHAFFPGGGRGGDAHFDEEENWLLDPFADPEMVEGTSLFAVAAHEFGHSLGLAHSSVQGALMYPWYQGLPPDFELPADDRHAIQHLYGAREDRLWGKNPYHDPTRTRPQNPRTTTTATSTSTTTTTTVRPHVRHKPAHTPRRPNHPHHYPVPDTCNTNYDAVSVIRGEVFIFKDKYLWRIGDKGLQKDYPTLINRLWYELPSNLSRIDAAYERNDKKIVFFSGRKYFVFDANRLLPRYPKYLTDLGLPPEIDRVDAAMVWGHNSKTYFFSGTMYWRFDEEVGRVELDYPRDMSMWNGVGYNIDAVFQWKDGITYFFKGKKYYKFNDLRMKIEPGYPQLSAPFWMGCPRTLEQDQSSDSDWPELKPRHGQPVLSVATHPTLSISMIVSHFLYIFNKYLFLYS